MDLSFIAIQLLGLVPSIISFSSLQSQNRSRILILQIVCSVMWFGHYALLGGFTAMLINCVSIFRAVLCYYNDKKWAESRLWLYFLCALYAGCSALTWDGLYCVLPCVSMILTSVALWSRNLKLTRLLFLINSPFFFVYDIMTGSYSCAVIEACAFVSFIIAIYRFDIKKPSAAENE